MVPGNIQRRHTFEAEQPRYGKADPVYGLPERSVSKELGARQDSRKPQRYEDRNGLPRR